jgi:hypothetical protein
MHLMLPGLVALGRWGQEPEALATVEALGNCYTDLGMHGGTNFWLELEDYPGLLATYAVGLGATIGGRDQLLANLLTRVPQHATRRDEDVPLAQAVCNRLGGYRELWNEVFYSASQKQTPVSLRLEDTFSEALGGFVVLQQSRERIFDRFEFVCGLHAYSQPNEIFGARGPIGNVLWRNRRSPQWIGSVLINEARAAGDEWDMFKVGLFGGSLLKFEEAHTGYLEQLWRVQR